MTDTTDKRGLGPGDPEEVGPALTPEGTLAAWVRSAMDRAAASGIDPDRVPLALGIPLGLRDGEPPGRG
jgi:hypothetical protein